MSAKQIFVIVRDEFVYGGHILSLGSVSIVFTSAILLNISINWVFLIVVYLITYIVYSYNRFREYEEDFLTNYDRTQHLIRYMKYIPLIISCLVLIVIGILTYFGSQLGLISGLLLLLFGLFYSMYFKKITEKIVGFKNFYVSFFWAFLVIFLVFYYSSPFDLSVLLLFIFIFLRWLVNTTFFDIKDIESDKKYNLNTIPVLYGKNKTLNYLHIINIFSLALIVIVVYKNIFSISFLSLSFFYFYSFYYIQKTKNGSINVNKLSYVMVDGEYLLWPIVLILGKFVCL